MRTQPEHVYRLFFQPGEVVEIRVAGLKGEKKGVWEGRAWGTDAWVFGYFDNEESFVEIVKKLDQAGATAIYFTPNPPRPELIHRVKNRLVLADKKRTLTSNHEIRCIRWLLIDLDPSKALRPAGISSSDKDLEYAQALGKGVKEWLKKDLGFPEPVGAMSGNGYHMMYRLPDLPNDIPTGKSISEASQLVKDALAAIQANFKDKYVDVDQQVFNAARIWKLYGTVARKGETSKERPHRRSHLFSSAPRALDLLGTVSKEQLEKLASMAPDPSSRLPVPTTKPKQKSKTTRYTHDWGELDIPGWLQAYNVQVSKIEEKGDQTKYILDSCVFDSSHKSPDAMFFKISNGPAGYKCLHNSCAGYKFKDARNAISGSDPLKQFMSGYDHNYDKKPSKEKSMATGILTEYTILPTVPFAGADGWKTPLKMDPSEFFLMSHTNRPRFTVKLMANYLAAYCAPLCCTSGVFWRYSEGVWNMFPEGRLNQMITQALGDKIQSEWIKSSISVLQAELNREETDWPVYSEMINVKNGMVDLSSIKPGGVDEDFDLDKLLKPHDPKYGSRVQLNVEYDVDSFLETKRWYKALNEIFPDGRPAEHGKSCLGDEKIRLLRQFAGYTLLNTTKYERCMVFFGGGANGKGTIMDTISSVIGEENVTELTIEDLGKSFNLPHLQTKMMVACAELPQREVGGSGLQKLKQCISGDIIGGELKFGKRLDFRNLAKFIFSMNLHPSIQDKSHGLSRKLLILPFTRKFEEHEMDKELRGELRKEKNGIFLWMLDGAIDLIVNKGFAETENLLREKNVFFKNIDPLMMYGEECLILGSEFFTPKADLHQHYVKWCTVTLHKPLGRTNFYLRLEQLYNLKAKRREIEVDGKETKPHCFLGIGIRDDVFG